MDINKIKSFNNISMNGSPSERVRMKKSDFTHHSSNLSMNTELYRPAKRDSLSGSEHLYGKSSDVSFKGDAKLITKVAKEALSANQEKIPAWAEKMGGADWFKRVLKSVNKNEAFYEALVALGVAGILKPICVLAMPGAEKEDKEMAATKNFVSAVTGFVLSNLILSPCSTAVNKITKSFEGKDPTHYIKDAKYVEALRSEELLTGMKSTLGDSFKTTYKKVWDVGVSPLKASITLAFMPFVLNAIFGKNKKKKEPKPVDNPLTRMPVLSSIRMDSDKKDKQIQAPSFTSNNNVSFTGGVSQIIDIAKEEVPKQLSGISKLKENYSNLLGEPIAKFMGKISTTKPAQKLVEGFAHFEKPSARWSDMASFAITYFYINNTKKSEKIDEERKLPLMINNFMVTAASSTAAFLIDKYTDKPMENILRGYIRKHECELLDKSNVHIVKTLKKAIDEGTENVDISALKSHAGDLLSAPADMSDNLKDAIKALTNNDIVQDAIKKNIIGTDDIARMAASGFEKQASSVLKNIMKTKSLTVFTLTVRFLVTVLMTPVIGKVVAMVNKKLGKDKNDNNEKPHSSIIPPAGSETIGIKDFMKGVQG